MKEYALTHKLSKLIVCLIVLGLLFLDGNLTVYSGIIVFVWFFGVNSVGYLLESMLHYRHKHDKV